MAVPTGDYASQFDNLGQALLLVAGALSAGAFLVTASYWARRYGVLPNWLTVSGYVVGVLQLAAALFFPFALFPIWVLVASIVLMRRDSQRDERRCACWRLGGGGSPRNRMTLDPRPKAEGAEV